MTFSSVLTGVNVLCYLSNLPASLESHHSLSDNNPERSVSDGISYLEEGRL